MSEFKSLDDILDYAMQKEQEAVDLYSKLAEDARNDAIKKTFLEFADEERGHKAKLQGVKEGKKMIGSALKVQDLKIAEYTDDGALGENPGYQDVLIFAMKQEKAAFKLYTDLAAGAPDAETKELFAALAQEEAKHKLRFEMEYDDNVLTEN